MGNRAKVKSRSQLEFRHQLGNYSHWLAIDSSGQTVSSPKDLNSQAVADDLNRWRKLCLERSATWTRITQANGQAWRKVADMKKLIRTRIVSSALLTLLPVVAVAQSNSPSTPAQPPIVARPTVVAPTAPPDRPNLPARPDRPASPGQPPPSQEIKDLTRNFQAVRQAFVKQQQELQQQLKTATDEQRKLIRQQLKDNLEQWMEQQRQQMKDTANQIKEIAPGLRDVGNNPHDGRGR